MDPGLGLVVNSMVPNESGEPKPPPKPPLKLPDGFLEKSHVRHALKYMPDDETREKALEVALAWKEKFQAEKWKPVVAAIEAASKEDNLRLSPQDTTPYEIPPTTHLSERPRAMTTASAPIVPQTISHAMPVRADLVRLHTATASFPSRRAPALFTPRAYRWDIVAPGPVSPLSPMPMGNSFSGRGLWENFTIPEEQFPEASTPVTALTHEPVSPIVPTDPAALAVYNHVKSKVDNLARKLCLARHKMDENSFVPVALIKPKDVTQAARMVLQHRQLKLKSTIAPDLPDKLQSHAANEAALRQQLCIRNEVELSEQFDWMNDEIFTMPFSIFSEDYDWKKHDVSTHFAVSILDEQREAIRMYRAHHKSDDLKIASEALEVAWAVRILEDAERCEADGSSSDSDEDDGYTYDNILWSINSQTSTGSEQLAAMVEELSNSDLTSLRSRSNTYQTISSTRSRGYYPQQSGISPSKDSRFPTRSNDVSASNDNHNHSHPFHRNTALRVLTHSTDKVSSGELSPEDRKFRHSTPNPMDLKDWAEELNKMEAMQANRQRSQTLYRRLPPGTNRMRSPTHLHSPTRRASMDSINPRISPTKSLHSRFSSSSSLSTTILDTTPRPSTSYRSLSSSLAAHNPYTKHTILDHQYHQRNASKASTRRHQRNTSKESMHESVRRHQHRHSTSSVQVLAEGSTREAQDEWVMELERMERRERRRQRCERGDGAECDGVGRIGVGL